MKTQILELPDVHFGDVSDDEHAPVDHIDGHEVDDDEELAETPADVIELLGFDPRELNDGTDDEQQDDQTEHQELLTHDSAPCQCHACRIKVAKWKQ